jgi:hypothetical protein
MLYAASAKANMHLTHRWLWHQLIATVNKSCSLLTSCYERSTCIVAKVEAVTDTCSNK